MPRYVSEYGGRTITLDDFLEARQAVESWANKTLYFSDQRLHDNICHLCTLASGMFFNSRKEADD